MHSIRTWRRLTIWPGDVQIVRTAQRTVADRIVEPASVRATIHGGDTICAVVTIIDVHTGVFETRIRTIWIV